MHTKLSLIMGGARSGKTRHAESLAESKAESIVGDSPASMPARTSIYLATGAGRDKEMQERIARHKADRAKSQLNWITVEEPLKLGQKIAELAQPNTTILVDCLTLWLSNCLCEDVWPEQRETFLNALKTALASDERHSQHVAKSKNPNPDCEIILVSNETGLGVIPMGELSRSFVDESGFLHQALAQIAHRVTFVVAGLPTDLKNS